MRILLVANVFPPVIGGSASVYKSICEHLGSDVMVVAPKQSHTTGQAIEGWRESDAQMGFPVYRVERLRAPVRTAPAVPVLGSVWRQVTEDLPIRKDVRREVHKVMQEFRPDAVCLGDLAALSWLGAELMREGMPVVQFIHGEELTVDTASRRLRQEMGAALRRLDGLIAVSSFTREQLVGLGVEPARIHLIVNGVDTARFTPGPRNSEVVAQQRLSGKKVLLTLARVEEKKGQDMVIRALPRILAVEPEAVYVIAGTGPHLDRLRELAAECGVAEAVRFAGRVADRDVVEYYRTCDIFLMPNRTLANGDTEGFGLVFLEAGACRKPVIGGRDGGVPDAVLDQQTGLLVNGNSVEEITQAVVRLLRDQPLADRLAEAGLAQAQRSDWREKSEEFRQACENARITRKASS